MIGAGAHAKAVEEYAVDAGTLKEHLVALQQAAQELGQWTEKSENTAKWSGNIDELTPTQATKLMEQLAQLAFPNDPPDVAYKKAIEASDKETIQ